MSYKDLGFSEIFIKVVHALSVKNCQRNVPSDFWRELSIIARWDGKDRAFNIFPNCNPMLSCRDSFASLTFEPQIKVYFIIYLWRIDSDCLVVHGLRQNHKTAFIPGFWDVVVSFLNGKLFAWKSDLQKGTNRLWDKAVQKFSIAVGQIKSLQVRASGNIKTRPLDTCNANKAVFVVGVHKILFSERLCLGRDSESLSTRSRPRGNSLYRPPHGPILPFYEKISTKFRIDESPLNLLDLKRRPFCLAV